MNVSDPGASRPQYYDRNPLDIASRYSASTVAPHGATTRWTYTVPASRKAYVELGQVLAARDGATATPGTVAPAIQLTPSGGSTGGILTLRLLTGAVGDNQNVVLGGAGLMQAGDALLGVTSDISTGGTVDYFVGFKATEFDA